MVKRHVYAPRGGWGVRAVVYLGRDRPHLHGAITLGQSPSQAEWEPSVYWLRGLANQASRVRNRAMQRQDTSLSVARAARWSPPWPCQGPPRKTEDVTRDGAVNVSNLIDLLLVVGTSCP